MKKLKRVLAVLLTAIMTLAMATTDLCSRKSRKLESYSESGKHIKRADDQSVQII